MLMLYSNVILLNNCLFSLGKYIFLINQNIFPINQNMNFTYLILEDTETFTLFLTFNGLSG